MPNLHSAVKRMRLAEKARQRNKAIKSKISSMRRVFFESAAAKDTEKNQKAFRAYCSALDKGAKKGTIKKNTAVRRKRRAAARLASLLNVASA